MSRATADVELVPGDLSSVGCALGLSCIAHSQIAVRRCSPRSLQDTKNRLLRKDRIRQFRGCSKTLATSDPAVDCLVLRIRKMGPSNRRAHAGASKIPARDTLIVESGMFLVIGNLSRAGCGGGLPRIAHYGTSNRRIRIAGPMVPALGTTTGQSGP